MTLGERIAILNDGALMQFATPLHIYRRPANLFVATFIGSPPINTIDGEVSSEGSRSEFSGDGFSVSIPGCDYSGECTLAVRPESLSMDRNAENAFRCSVQRLEPLGNELLVHLSGPGDRSWVARVDPESSCAVGDAVNVFVDSTRIHLFAGANKERIPTRADDG